MISQELPYYVKSLYLFLSKPLVLITVLLVPIIIQLLIRVSPQSFISVPTTIILELLQITLGLSVPAFLHQNKPGINKLVTITLRNLKRCFLPLLLLAFIGGSLLIILAAIYVHIHGRQNHTTLLLTIQIIAVIINVLGGALFIFVPTYFSVLHKGYFSSLKQSILYTFSNWPFYLSLIILGLPISLIVFLINTRLLTGSPFVYLIGSIDGLFWVIATGAAYLLLESNSQREHISQRDNSYIK